MRRPLRERAGLLVLLAVAVTAAGCVRQDDPKVGVTKVEADLVFGVKEPPETVTPANQGVDQPFDEEAFGQLPGIDEKKFESSFKLPKSQGVVDDCPKASPTATARDVVDVVVNGRPREGIYRWKRGGEQKQLGAPASVPPIPVSGFERRIVRNHKKVDDDTYTFETVQVDTERTAVVSTWQVETAAINQQTTGGVPVVSGPRVGDPERGLSLMSLEVVDNRGEVISSFSTPVGVLYLPLPVASGESYQSVGVDPRTGQTIVHDAQVLGRERIDACGDVVDGWVVQAQQTTSNGRGGPATTVAYRYLVATQWGGQLIFEELKYQTETLDNRLTFTLGQIDPDPLPPAQG